VIHSDATFFFKLLLSSFFFSHHFKLVIDSWQPNKQNGRRLHRYYIVFFVHRPTTNVREERANAKSRENEELYVACYRRNTLARWLPSTYEEQVCMWKLERKKWEREWEKSCPYINLCACSLSVVRLSLSFSSTSFLFFTRRSSSKQQTTKMREIVHSKF
jgi:hypothetical protein